MAGLSARADTGMVAFAEHNGCIAWENINTDLFYALEWRSSMRDSNAWERSYASLQQIHSAAPTVTVYVPLFYRVVSASNRFVFDTRLMQTGQTNIYQAGDDGSLRRGVPWSVPRFTDHGDETVTDNNTGLMWLKDANRFGPLAWYYAIIECTNLTIAGYNDWRMPNLIELASLLDRGQYGPALPVDRPFSNVVSAYYWTSTTYAYDETQAWALWLTDGDDRNRSKPSLLYVWPVRGGL